MDQIPAPFQTKKLGLFLVIWFAMTTSGLLPLFMIYTFLGFENLTINWVRLAEPSALPPLAFSIMAFALSFVLPKIIFQRQDTTGAHFQVRAERFGGIRLSALFTPYVLRLALTEGALFAGFTIALAAHEGGLFFPFFALTLLRMLASFPSPRFMDKFEARLRG